VLERYGVILKGGVQIRLGQMPGIARFGKQTQIGKAQLLNQLFFFLSGISRNIGP
jgi:hypothetical protein